MTKILVLTSGGTDSGTLLTLAVRRFGKENVAAMTFNYGQRNRAEVIAADRLRRALGVPRLFVKSIAKIFEGKSHLIDCDQPLLRISYEDILKHEGPMPTNVPVRNPIFLSIGVATAMVHGYEEVWIGVHADDIHGDAYPDCRPDSIGAIAAGLRIGSNNTITVKAPLQYLTKADVIVMGSQLGVPWELTYSCYAKGPIQCGVCTSCIIRREAFKRAGIRDPTRYEE